MLKTCGIVLLVCAGMAAAPPERTVRSAALAHQLGAALVERKLEAYTQRAAEERIHAAIAEMQSETAGVLEREIARLFTGRLATMQAEERSAVERWARTAFGRIAPREDESLLEKALEPEPPETAPIPALERLEREVALAASREFDLHYRLRPVLREIAASRLERRGARLDSDSKRARELLGDELWSLTEPDREPPTNRQAPGMGFEELERTVERLERL